MHGPLLQEKATNTQVADLNTPVCECADVDYTLLLPEGSPDAAIWKGFSITEDAAVTCFGADSAGTLSDESLLHHAVHKQSSVRKVVCNLSNSWQALVQAGVISNILQVCFSYQRTSFGLAVQSCDNWHESLKDSLDIAAVSLRELVHVKSFRSWTPLSL
jgi:hypothetical protein